MEVPCITHEDDDLKYLTVQFFLVPGEGGILFRF